MSASSLEKFLKTLQSELNKDEDYRTLVANRRPHFFRFRVGDLVTETVKQFEKKKIPITSEEKEMFRTFASEMKDDFIKQLADIKSVGQLRQTPLTISFQFTSSTETNQILTEGQLKSKYRDPASVFQKIKDS